MSHISNRFTALAVVAVIASCSPRANGSYANTRHESDLPVTVTNDNFLDVVVYIVRGASRIRIGEAGGSSTARLWVRRDLIVDGTVRLLADVIGSNERYLTDAIPVGSPDQQVQLLVAPKVAMSSFAVWHR